MLVRELSETKTIKIEDAEFVIGVIPKRLWRDLSLRLGASSGLLGKFKDRTTSEITSDPEFRTASKEVTECYFELARLGVRGHSNIKSAGGSDIPFKKDEKGYADPSMVEIYDLNEILVPLGIEVLNYNQVSETERKN